MALIDNVSPWAPRPIAEAASRLRQMWVDAKWSPYYSGSLDFDRIYHAHIRKSGGTSINQSLLEAITGSTESYWRLASSSPHIIENSGRPVVGWDRNLIKRGAFFFGFSHRSIQDLALDNRTFTFTVLREPVSRVLSYYNMLCDLRAAGSSSLAHRREVKFLGQSFRHFLQQVPRRHLQAQLFMFDKSFSVQAAVQRVSDLDFVGILGVSEHLVFEELNSIFGLGVEPRWVRKSRSRYTPTVYEYEELWLRLSEEIEFFEIVSKLRDKPL